MNKPKSNAETVENRFRGYRVMTPSPELKERVLGAARDAWKATSADEISWTAPILRLAASLIVAVIPVLLAHSVNAPDATQFFALERESAVPPGKVRLWTLMTDRTQLEQLLRQAPARPRANVADIVMRHQRALLSIQQEQTHRNGR